jgi:4-amino-4-deoxy-L-arabinose transferase-like glycosyltransferase
MTGYRIWGRCIPEWLLLSAVCAAMGLPFINKALQADSDMLLHASRMTALSPLAPPLGEYGRHMSVYNIHTGMPPASLYHRCPHGPLLQLLLAPVAGAAKNREWPYHLALFPFSVAAVLGCFFTLSLLTTRKAGLLASVLFATAPVFVVNSHNIMWDVPVCALMIWSLGLLVWGTRQRSVPLIAISGALAGCAAVTKMSAFPLIACSFLFIATLRNARFLLAWGLPVAAIPLAWAVHNLALYHAIQFLSTNHLNVLPSDVRYKLERTAAYVGGLAALPLGWWWIMVRPGMRRALTAVAALGGLHGAGRFSFFCIGRSDTPRGVFPWE